MSPTPLSLFLIVAPLFFLSILGAWFRYNSWYSQESHGTFSWLLIHLFTPALVFHVIMSTPHKESIIEVVVTAITGFGVTVGAISFAAFIASKYIAPEKRASFSLASGLCNYGYLPIPIMMAFSSETALSRLFLYNIGVEAAIWTYGVYTLHPKNFAELHRFFSLPWRKIFSPPLIALLLALLLQNPYGDVYPESGIGKVIYMVGQATIPIAFLFLGAIVYDSFPSWPEVKKFQYDIVMGVVTKMVFIPCILLSLVWMFPISSDLKEVICIQSLMPSAVIPIILVHRAKMDVTLPVFIVLMTTFVSLLTIPLCLRFVL